MNWGEWVMKFKTSLFRKGIILSDFKRFWWVSALYTLFLFFVFPFNLMMRNTQNLDPFWLKEDILRIIRLAGQNDIQIIMLCIVPVILAVLLFRYLHVSKATAMLHSLPCDRKTLFLSHNTAGLALLVLPVLMNGLVLFILQSVTYLRGILTPLDIFNWIGYTLLFGILFFAFTVFVGMFTGNSIAQIAFTYILHILPVGLSVLFDYNLNYLLYGYGRDRNFTAFTESLPMLVLSEGMVDSLRFTMWHIVVYAILAILFFAAAMFVYEKRKLESSGDIIAFSILSPVFKYGVTFCFMLLGGGYFGMISNHSFGILLLGYVLCSVFGYCIAEVLMQKSIKIWSSYKGYLGYAAFLIVVFIGLTADVTGFIHRVPNAEDVQRVYFGYSLDEWTYIEKSKDSAQQKMKYDSVMFFEDSSNIRSLVQLHKELANPQLMNTPYAKDGPYRFIIYTLKNGKYLIRQYPVDERKYSAYLKPVYESMEYKNSRFPVINQKTEDIKYIEIKDYRSPKKPVILANNTELKEFTEVLKKDISGLTYESLVQNSKENLNINIMNVKQQNLTYALRDNYKETMQWLKNKGYYENIALLPSDIETLTLEKIQSSSNTEYDQRTGKILDKRTGQPFEEKKLEVKDRKVIEELFKLCLTREPDLERQADVLVMFTVKGSPGYYQFSEDLSKDAPVSAEAREYFRQLGLE